MDSPALDSSIRAENLVSDKLENVRLEVKNRSGIAVSGCGDILVVAWRVGAAAHVSGVNSRSILACCVVLENKRNL